VFGKQAEVRLLGAREGKTAWPDACIFHGSEPCGELAFRGFARYFRSGPDEMSQTAVESNLLQRTSVA
jgi:hypothetical protein